MVVFGPITPRLVQKGSRGSPRVDFGSILGRKLEKFIQNVCRVLIFTPTSTQKMADAPPCISYFLGGTQTQGLARTQTRTQVRDPDLDARTWMRAGIRDPGSGNREWLRSQDIDPGPREPDRIGADWVLRS